MNNVMRIAFLCFFASHIPITLLIDGQSIFPQHFYPQGARNLYDFYTETFDDFLMARDQSPLWLKSVVCCEFLLQWPFFWFACYCLMNRSNKLRIPAIAYGAHTATTLVPILSEFALSPLPLLSKAILFLFYLPYLLFPLAIMLLAMHGDLFDETTSTCVRPKLRAKAH